MENRTLRIENPYIKKSRIENHGRVTLYHARVTLHHARASRSPHARIKSVTREPKRSRKMNENVPKNSRGVVPELNHSRISRECRIENKT